MLQYCEFWIWSLIQVIFSKFHIFFYVEIEQFHIWVLNLFQISNYVYLTIQHVELNLHSTQLPRKKHMYDTRPSTVVNFILSLCLKLSTTCKICYKSTRVRVKVEEYGKKIIYGREYEFYWRNERICVVI